VQHTFYFVYLVKLIKYQAKDDNTFYQGVEQTTQEDTLGRKKKWKPTKGTRGQGDNMEMIVFFLDLRKTYLRRG
jgi:hypothetical protein